MSAQPTDGGPAFPHTHEEFEHGAIGMSLRDYFAAKALQGLLANSSVPNDLFIMGDGTDENGSVETYAAESAYDYADAMLAAREAKR